MRTNITFNSMLLLENIRLIIELESIRKELDFAKREAKYWGTEHDLLLDQYEKLKRANRPKVKTTRAIHN